MRLSGFRPVVILAAVLAIGGCARGVDFNPDPGETYAVSVVNTMPHAMIVSFDDGTGTRLLGTVGANRTERFVVARAGTATVSIVATDEAGTHTVRRTVTLVPGQTVEVRLN